jgi:hypothetical protein
MEATRANDLIHDWNTDGEARGKIGFDDETLRDGLQSPSVKDPSPRRQDPAPPSHGRPRHRHR